MFGLNGCEVALSTLLGMLKDTVYSSWYSGWKDRQTYLNCRRVFNVFEKICSILEEIKVQPEQLFA